MTADAIAQTVRDSASAPGEVVGVLGAGQLGRMLALAGYPMGLRFKFLSDRDDDPAAQIAPHQHADYADLDAVVAFARTCSVVTFEFENVPVAAVQAVADAGVPIAPGPGALRVAQDRLLEKRMFTELEIGTPAYAAVNDEDDAERAAAHVGLPMVLKTRRMGYDGKGQRVVRTIEEARAAVRALAPDASRPADLIAEQFIAFEREVSSIAVRARPRSGSDFAPLAFYPLTQNEHEGGILRRSVAPAPDQRPRVRADAENGCRRVLNHLGYLGVLAIEWFEVDGRLIANEMAPRVHNSGHWTIDAAATSQFENHLRAILGWSLGPTHATAHAEMINLIGGHEAPSEILEQDRNVRLHLYGKAPREGRKVGHITRLAPRNAT